MPRSRKLFAKRKFFDNRHKASNVNTSHTTTSDGDNTSNDLSDNIPITASRRKLSTGILENEECIRDGFQLIDFDLLKEAICKSLCCLDCHSTNITIQNEKEIGVVMKLLIYCQSCKKSTVFYSSQKINSQSNSNNSLYESNIRFAYAMCVLVLAYRVPRHLQQLWA